jgi:acyl-coenzyme A thioesterase PaaI-like protein
MHYKVTGKQPNSKMCLVCGLKNAYGLKTFFYELENDELMAVCRPMEEHQSYPNLLHGGITTALLDETIGRAILIKSQGEVWGVTLEFTTRYKKSIPLDGELRIIGRITKEERRVFEGTGELLLSDGEIAAEGYGKYMKLPLEKIADFDFDEQEWKVTLSEDDPTLVEL